MTPPGSRLPPPAPLHVEGGRETGKHAIQVRVPAYVVTLVCPLCHKQIVWANSGVTVCEHCGRAFTVKVVPGR